MPLSARISEIEELGDKKLICIDWQTFNIQKVISISDDIRETILDAFRKGVEAERDRCELLK